MKTSKFTEAQIAFVLKQAEDGASIAEVCRKAGISDATFYNWTVLSTPRLDPVVGRSAIEVVRRIESSCCR